MCIFVDGERHFVAIGIDTRLARDRLRPRSQPRQAVEQLIHALQLLRRTAEDRRDLTFTDTARQTENQLIGRKLDTREILLHQVFARFGDRFVHRGAQTVETMLHIGDRHLDRFTVFITIGAILQQVDVALDLVIHNVRHDDRADGRAEDGFQIFEHFIEIRAFAVKLVDKQQFGDTFFRGGAERFLHTDGNTALTRDDDQRTARGTHAFTEAARKIKKTRGVQQIHLRIFPFNRYDRRRHGCLATDLLCVKVADRVAVRHTTETVGVSGQIIRRLYQRGFTRARVTCNNDVTDIFCCVLLHRTVPFRRMRVFAASVDMISTHSESF